MKEKKNLMKLRVIIRNKRIERMGEKMRKNGIRKKDREIIEEIKKIRIFFKDRLNIGKREIEIEEIVIEELIESKVEIRVEKERIMIGVEKKDMIGGK